MTGIRLRAQESFTIDYEASVADALYVSTKYYDYYGDVYGRVVSSYKYIALPYELFYWMIEKLGDLLSNYEWDSDYRYVFNCNEIDNLPTIDVLFGDYWIEVLVSDYIDNPGTGTCSFNFRASYDSEVAILGSAFMKNYYIVHDMDNM